ncbi:MAG: GmrSD restriction endonuclease domain-containing protein [Candidatus Nanopelagicales bacterium]
MAKREATVKHLVDMIEAGSLRLPEMQREYVWKGTQVRDLLDSLYRGYPSGVILAWQTNETVDTTDFAVATRADGGEGSLLLLDGQQRLTSLSSVIRGEPVKVKNRKRPIDILFNLDHPEKLEELYEDFDDLDEDGIADEDEDSEEITDEDLQSRLKKMTFMVSSGAIASLPNWVSVTDVFKSNSDSKFLKRAGVLTFDDPKYDKYTQRLAAVRAIKDYTYRMDVLESSLSYEEVTEIFVRVNSAGARLRASDLALAQITARWRGSLATFRDFRDSCASNLGFSLDLGLHLRALVAHATGQARFLSAGSIPLETLKSSWVAAQKSMTFAINFCKSNCDIESPALFSSPLVLITLAYWAHSLNYKIADHEVATMKRWVLTQNLKGHYSRGSSETILSQDLTILRAGDGADGLLNALKLQVGRLDVTADELVGRSTNGGIFKTMFLAFRRDDAKDWRSGVKISIKHGGKSDKLQFHHVFPRATLRDHYGDSLRHTEVNDIANLAFIGGETNRHISADLPKKYLAALQQEHRDRLTAQQVPADTDLYEMSEYRAFLEARRQLLASRLNAFLTE